MFNISHEEIVQADRGLPDHWINEYKRPVTINDLIQIIGNAMFSDSSPLNDVIAGNRLCHAIAAYYSRTQTYKMMKVLGHHDGQLIAIEDGGRGYTIRPLASMNKAKLQQYARDDYKV